MKLSRKDWKPIWKEADRGWFVSSFKEKIEARVNSVLRKKLLKKIKIRSWAHWQSVEKNEYVFNLEQENRELKSKIKQLDNPCRSER